MLCACHTHGNVQRVALGGWLFHVAHFQSSPLLRSYPRLNDVDCAAHQILKLHSQWVLGWLPPSPSRVTPLRASYAGCCVKMCSSLRRNLLGVGSPALAGCGGRAHGARCPCLLSRGGHRLPLRPQAPQTRVCVRGPQPHPSGPATLTGSPACGPRVCPLRGRVRSGHLPVSTWGRLAPGACERPLHRL